MVDFFDAWNDPDNYYPLILLPTGVEELLMKEITDEDIMNHLDLSFPICNLDILCSEWGSSKTYRVEDEKFLSPDVIYPDSSNFRIMNVPLSRPGKYILVEETKTLYNQQVVIFIFFSLFLLLLLQINIWVFGIIYSIFLSLFYFIIMPSCVKKVTVKKNKSKATLKRQFQELKTEILNCRNKLAREYEAKIDDIQETIIEKRGEAEKEIILNALRPEISIKKLTDTFKRGYAEEFFLAELLTAFGKQVSVNVIAQDKSFSRPYRPDFVIICSQTNFHIDIEIDEPYDFEERKPIHDDRSNDSERNNYFLNLNWGVIRFAEQQIIQYPQECVQLIESVLNGLRNKDASRSLPVPFVKKWTYEEALIMISLNFRELYLKEKFNLKKLDFQKQNRKPYEGNVDDLPF